MYKGKMLKKKMKRKADSVDMRKPCEGNIITK